MLYLVTVILFASESPGRCQTALLERFADFDSLSGNVKAWRWFLGAAKFQNAPAKLGDSQSMDKAVQLTVERHTYTRRYWIALGVSLLLLEMGNYLNAVSTEYSSAVATGPILNDLGFRIFGFRPIYPDIADAALLIANIVFAVYVLGKRLYEDIPFFIGSIAIFEIFRAAILPLTPLPTPIESRNFGLFGSVLLTGGTFPSGHAGQAFLLFFLARWRDRKSKYAMLAIAMLESFAMIAGRGHYTIDVVASFFIVFFISTVARKYWHTLRVGMVRSD